MPKKFEPVPSKTFTRLLPSLLLLIAGGFSLAILIAPFPLVKAWVDGLVADGQVDSFTLAVHFAVRSVAGLAGLSLLAGAWLLFYRPSHAFGAVQAAWAAAGREAEVRAGELRQLLAWLAFNLGGRRELAALLALAVLGAGFRLAYLSKPVGHDEAYTFMAFASRGLLDLVSDYHLPNNHVLHSILVHLAFRALGNQPWILRLPTFLAGILMIPATYLVARSLGRKSASLLAATLVASLPVLIDYSTNARGYTLLAVFSLAIALLAAYLRRRRSGTGWALFVVLSAAGFYTIPVMLYPFGMVLTWLFLNSYGRASLPLPGTVQRRALLLSVAAVFLLSALLYSPIVLGSGLETLLRSASAAALTWPEFFESLLARLRNTWAEWTGGLHPLANLGLLCGLVAAAFTGRQEARGEIPLGAAAGAWIAAVLLVQRVAPWPRIWLFLLPFALIGASAGIAGLLERAFSRFAGGALLARAILLAILLGTLAAGASRAASHLAAMSGRPGELEAITLFLGERLEAGDVVVAASPDGVALRYYFTVHGLSLDYTRDIRNRPFRRAFVLVDPEDGQTLEAVLEKRGLAERISPSSARIIYFAGSALLYEATP